MQRMNNVNARAAYRAKKDAISFTPQDRARVQLDFRYAQRTRLEENTSVKSRDVPGVPVSGGLALRSVSGSAAINEQLPIFEGAHAMADSDPTFFKDSSDIRLAEMM